MHMLGLCGEMAEALACNSRGHELRLHTLPLLGCKLGQVVHTVSIVW